MAVIDDLRAEVAALTTNVEAVNAKIAELKTITAGVPEADVKVQVDLIKTANAALVAAVV